MILKAQQRHPGQFIFGPCVLPPNQFRDGLYGLAQRAAARSGEFLFIHQPQVLDDGQRDIFRFQDFNLAIDGCGIQRQLDPERALLLHLL